MKSDSSKGWGRGIRHLNSRSEFLQCPPLATQVSKTVKGKTVNGWIISLPSGGSLLAYSFPKPFGLPGGAILSVWIYLPESSKNQATGQCQLPCTKLPPLPNDQCGSTDADSCLPVYTEESIFPAGALSALEALAAMPKSTRASFNACTGQPPDTVCTASGCTDISNYDAPLPPPPPAGNSVCGFPATIYEPTACRDVGGGQALIEHSDGTFQFSNTEFRRKNYCFPLNASNQADCYAPVIHGSPYFGSSEAAYQAAVQACESIPTCSQVAWMKKGWDATEDSDGIPSGNSNGVNRQPKKCAAIPRTRSALVPTLLVCPVTGKRFI